MTTLWIFYSLKERQRHLKRNLESQQQESEKLQLLVDHERRINEIKLNEFTQRLIEKTELIDDLKERQSKLIDEKSEWSAELKSKLRDTQILTNEDWDEYLKLFDQVNPGYYERIKTELPQLSNAEVRWVILHKMNLTQNKMASVLGVTSGAVKKTRQRLLKKLEISEDQTIEDFFRNFY
jgi:DNA-binding transcriptional regulator YiaG